MLLPVANGWHKEFMYPKTAVCLHLQHCDCRVFLVLRVIYSAGSIVNHKTMNLLFIMSLRTYSYHSFFARTQKFWFQRLQSCPSAPTYSVVLYRSSHNCSRISKSPVTLVTISDAAHIMPWWLKHAQQFK